MMNEHDRVVLLKNLPHAGLVAGDVGTIVHIYADRVGLEVEFISLDSHTRIPAPSKPWNSPTCAA